MPAKILIIDDEPTTVKMLQNWLKSAGRNSIVAYDGLSGFDLAKKDLPDLILLDLMLPKETGTKVAAKLKRDPITKEIPIIFITAMMGVENDKGDEFIEIEGSHYKVFAKPLHRMKLLSEIRKQLNIKANKNR